MTFLSRNFLPASLLAGVASIACAGTVAAHTLTLQLPDGTVEQINYSGDVAPQVSFAPPGAVAAQSIDSAVGPQSPFALMQRIAAQMDREADAMVRQMQEIAAQPLPGPGQAIQVDLSKLPPGTESYSFVSTLSPSGVCSQSTEIIARGAGQKPQVITHRTGHCGASAAPGAPTRVAAPEQVPAAPAAPRRVQRYQTNSADHPDYRSMFREASW